MKLDDLLSKYPNAFKYKAKNYGFDHFGFECGDGWAELLEPIAQYLEEKNSGTEPVYIAQIKEKFGGLRFYTHSGDEKLQELITEAEGKSFRTCEECGKPGAVKNRNGWLSTRCVDHER